MPQEKIKTETVRTDPELFRAMLEQTPVATAFYTGEEVTISYANDTMLRYWGKDASVIGKTLIEAVPELRGQHFPDTIAKVYITGEPYTGVKEEALLNIDGTLRTYYFNFIYKPLFNKEGKICGVHHTAMDVSLEVLAQKKLEESEKNLRNLILRAPVAMCIFRGPEYKVEIVNEKMLESWGKNESEVINKPIYEALPEAKGQGFEELLDRVYTTGEPVTAFGAAGTLTRNGVKETRYVNLVYDALRDLDGTVSGIMIVNTDVTEQVLAKKEVEQNEAELQKRVEERTQELAAAINELKRSNSYLEEFAHAASHDLKEPIRKIHYFTDRLKTQLADKLSPEDEKMFGRVEHATQRMNALINDLLLYSHVSQKPREKELVNLNEKVTKVMEDLELEIEEKKASITVDPLPEVQGYKRQLQQLFHNLLTNALKYIDHTRKPEIRITAETVDGSSAGLISGKQYHKISVTDNGIGFEPEQGERIFQMFQRLHGKAEYEGTGVGLSIARKVAENHDGQIIAEGRPGEGATFSIYLPVE